MTLRVQNPATGALEFELPTDDRASVEAKLERARAAQPSWANAELETRLRCLAVFRDKLLDEQTALARTLAAETGKPIAQGKNEIKGLAARVDYFLAKVPQVLAGEVVHTEAGLEERITLEPLGVVGNISAWNYPYFVGGNVFVPALLAGNAVLYKPSEFSSLTGLEIDRLLGDSGIPNGIFLTLVGGAEVGQALLEQPLDGVFFTGSFATGSQIAGAARRRMIPVGLELGGKDPAYVTDDVDPKAAAVGLADGAFYNAGQSCCAVERIYVHQKVYDTFVKSFVDEVKGFVVGDPLVDGTYLGPLTRPAQLDVLSAQVEDAKQKGAKILLGGGRMDRPGNYFEPTVVVDVTHEMTLMKDESFGPVIGIQKVSGDEEAERLMNDTEYGLTASVFSRDLSRAENILRGVSAGSAYINCCDRVSPRLPWSGRNNSGLGSTLGTLGVQAFVRPKAWHVRG